MMLQGKSNVNKHFKKKYFRSEMELDICEISERGVVVSEGEWNSMLSSSVSFGSNLFLAAFANHRRLGNVLGIRVSVSRFSGHDSNGLIAAYLTYMALCDAYSMPSPERYGRMDDEGNVIFFIPSILTLW